MLMHTLVYQNFTVLEKFVSPPPQLKCAFSHGSTPIEFGGGVSFLANHQPRFCPVKITLHGHFRLFKTFSQGFRVV